MMQRMMERDLRGLHFDDDFDDFGDLDAPSPSQRAPVPFALPRGIGSMSYEVVTSQSHYRRLFFMVEFFKLSRFRYLFIEL